jgi:tetratricopeptide (TPR) repeat protein
MVKIIKLIFFMSIFFIQCSGITTQSLENHNQLAQTEKIILPALIDRWALIIGISKYKDDNIIDLNYADKDAYSFYDSLIIKCRFKKEQVGLLLNENATYENIRRKISGWLFNNTNKNDKIIIFFSGHGYRDIDNNGDEDDGFDEFLIPFDYQSDDISSAIRDDEFAYWINSLKAENILLIFDSCFSGGAAKAKGIINKSINIKGEIKVDNFVRDIFGEVPRVGVSLLGASKADQLSFEEPKFNMGVFTYYLIDSMDKRSDFNLDNKITIQEIFDCIKPKVMNFSKSNYNLEQEPILIDTMKSPFELVYIPVEINISTGKNKEKINNLLKMANLAEDRNRKIELLEECSKLDPKNEDMHSALALQHFFSENYDKAIYHYEIAISLVSERKDFDKVFKCLKLSRYYTSLSEVYESKGLLEEAKQNIKKAIDMEKSIEEEKNFELYKQLLDLHELYNQLGDLHYKNNELNEAIQAYLYSIKFNKIQDEVYFKLSMIYIKLMKYSEALSILETAIEINPDFSNFYYLNGLLYKYIYRNINKSNELLKKYLDLNKILKIEIDSISKFKEMLEKYPSSEIFLSNIIFSLEEIIKKYDFYADAYIDLINISNKYKKDVEKSKNYYRKLIEMYPFFEEEKKLLLIK